jgi:hypothetical protein
MCCRLGLAAIAGQKGVQLVRGHLRKLVGWKEAERSPKIRSPGLGVDRWRHHGLGVLGEKINLVPDPLIVGSCVKAIRELREPEK